MNSIRFKDGVDCWTCSCGSVNLSCRICRCGKSYADILSERNERTSKFIPKVSHKKTRPPASRGQFTESYYFPKEQK